MKQIVTRFPPSPTGYLHIGNARTAVFNWLYARHMKGKFVLRIEDTDRERSTQAAVDAIFEALEWLGIDWDEGPYYQTKRLDVYDEHVQKLIEAGHAYGMAPSQVFFRITLPQMVRHALPSFGNNWLVLVKTTALVSVIGLHDMVYSAGLAGGATRKPFTFYLVVALLFLVITALSNVCLRWAEKRFSVGVRKA